MTGMHVCGQEKIKSELLVPRSTRASFNLLQSPHSDSKWLANLPPAKWPLLAKLFDSGSFVSGRFVSSGFDSGSCIQ
jgi:hypothetical protein